MRVPSLRVRSLLPRGRRRSHVRPAPLIAAACEALEERRLLTSWQTPPAGGVSLTPDDTPADDLVLRRRSGTDATLTRFAVDAADGVPFDEAVRVEVGGEYDPAWSVQLQTNTVGDVAAGDTLLLVLFARGTSDEEGGTVEAGAKFQQNGGSANGGRYAAIAGAEIDAGADWVQYLAPVAATRDQPGGTHNFTVHLGAQAQTVEIGGLQILNYRDLYGPDELPRTRIDYEGRAADAAWRAEADARIDEFRKADLAVHVVDADGRAIEGAEVRVEMTRHEYQFGATVHAVFLAITAEEYAAQPQFWKEKYSWEDVLKYRETVERNFNKVVFGNDLRVLRWIQSASDDGTNYRRVWTDRAFEWLADRDIEVRGHFGAWGPIDPDKPWNNGEHDTGPGFDAYTLNHIREKLTWTDGRVGEWDAINHIVGWGETLQDRYGTEFYAEVMELMRGLAPQAELWVNEGQIIAGGGRTDAYLQVVRDLIDLGQRPDGIGFMGHYRDGSLLGMAELRETLDRFAALVPNLQLTELDFETYDRDLQADYLGDVLRTAFSHEATEGVVQWGFWENKHWRPEASLWEDDWTPRQVGRRYRDLVFGEWWTDKTALTAADGAAAVRGFKGDYAVTVTVNGETQIRRAELTDGGLSLTVAFGWQTLPEGGVSLLPDETPLDDLRLSVRSGAAATTEIVAVGPSDGVPFGQALRVDVTDADGPRWAVQLVLDPVGNIAEGDTLMVAFFARGDGGGEDGSVKATAYLQQNGGDFNSGRYDKLVTAPVGAGNGWRQYLAPATATSAQPDGAYNFVVHLAFKPQTVEIGGLQLLNYRDLYAPEDLPKTLVTYQGREADAAWRVEAGARIDEFRKADLAVNVVDQYGRAIEGAEVRVEMTRHEFGFGTAVDAWVLGITRSEYDDLPQWRRDRTSWQEILTYRDIVEANFNKVVLENDLKIGGWQAGASNDNATFRRVWTDRALQWLADRDIEVRGHYGVWGPIENGGWAAGGFDTSRPGYDRFLIEHLRDKLPEIGDRVAEWDAVNHPVGWGPETLLDRFGPEFYAEVFALFDELAPNSEHWINEGQIVSGGGRIDAYFAAIEAVIAAGETPDGIGFMGHFNEGSLTGMDALDEIFDRYAGLIDRLQITELDVTTFDRDLQADYFGDFLTQAFSRGEMDGIVQWGFWEGNHWRPESSLWRDDFSLRPVGERFRQLLFDEWWTTETLATGLDGVAGLRGFRGDYTVTVTVDGETRAFEAALTGGGLTLTAAFETDRPAVAAVGRTGTVTVSQTDSGQWHRVDFPEAIPNAVVVAGAAGGGDPVTVRTRNVSATGFEFQLDEWDYQDGARGATAVSWAAVSAGRHELPDGSVLLAGITPSTHRWSRVDLSRLGLSGTPAVFAQAGSTRGAEAVTVRLRDVSADRFRLRLQEEERGGRHATERIDWIAVFPPAGADEAAGAWTSATGGGAVGRTADAVTHRDHAVAFGGTFGAGPVTLAQLQTHDGGDAATARVRSSGPGGATLFVEEEQSRDAEMNHTAEVVAWWALPAGALFALDPDAPPPTPPAGGGRTGGPLLAPLAFAGGSPALPPPPLAVPPIRSGPPVLFAPLAAAPAAAPITSRFGMAPPQGRAGDADREEPLAPPIRPVRGSASPRPAAAVARLDIPADAPDQFDAAFARQDFDAAALGAAAGELLLPAV